jgi:hypothetical protein
MVPIFSNARGVMASRNQVAGAERRAKEREPEKFCRFKDCLWRLRTFAEKASGWCPRHEPAPVKQ